jgi:hypothetical protein
VGAADGGFDAVAVVLLEHADVFVAELVGDVLDGESGVGHQAGGGVAQEVRCPSVSETSSTIHGDYGSGQDPGHFASQWYTSGGDLCPFIGFELTPVGASDYSTLIPKIKANLPDVLIVVARAHRSSDSSEGLNARQRTRVAGQHRGIST